MCMMQQRSNNACVRMDISRTQLEFVKVSDKHVHSTLNSA